MVLTKTLLLKHSYRRQGFPSVELDALNDVLNGSNDDVLNGILPYHSLRVLEVHIDSARCFPDVESGCVPSTC